MPPCSASKALLVDEAGWSVITTQGCFLATVTNFKPAGASWFWWEQLSSSKPAFSKGSKSDRFHELIFADDSLSNHLLPADSQTFWAWSCRTSKTWPLDIISTRLAVVQTVIPCCRGHSREGGVTAGETDLSEWNDVQITKSHSFSPDFHSWF